MLGIAALGLRLAFFGISVSQVPESSDESLSMLQAKTIIEEGRRPLLVMANPYQFPVESYLHVPFVKILPRNAFGARIIPFILSLAATIIFIITLFGIARLQTAWPALLLLLFPSAYILTLGSAYFIPQHSSFALLSSLTLYLAFRMRTSRAPALLALTAGFCAGLAFSNHMLALALLAVLGIYALFGPRLSFQIRIIPAFTIGTIIGLIPYLLAIRLIPGAYGTVTGVVSSGHALHRIWEITLNSALTGVMGIQFCLFPDGGRTLTLVPGLGPAFAVFWICLLLAVTALRIARFFRRFIETRRVTVERNDVLTGVAWLGFVMFIYSSRSHSHTYRYLLPLAWVFPFMVSYFYARLPRVGRVLTGVATVLLAGFNIFASLTLMREWSRPGFAAKEANLFDLKPAINYLVSRGIHHAYASYWLAYRVTYETGNRILCSQPLNERFVGWSVPYKEQVDSATNIACLMAPRVTWDAKRFENDLAKLDVKYRRELFGNIAVYTDFCRETNMVSVPIPQKFLRASVSHNPADARLLVDGDPRTRWQTQTAQQKGMWIQIILPKPEMLNGAAIIYTGFPKYRSGTIRIMGLTDSGWKDVTGKDIVHKFDGITFRNEHPVYGLPIQTISFPPFKTSSLKIMISEPKKKCDWIIWEVELYRALP